MSAVGMYGPEVVLNGGVPAPLALPNRSITVKTTAGAAATLYTDATGSTTTSNVVVTSGVGELSFFAAPGFYDIVYTDATGSTTKRVEVPVNTEVASATYLPRDSTGRAAVVRQRINPLGGQLVASYGYAYNTTATSSSANGYTSRCSYYMVHDTTDVRIVYPMGWYLGGASGEASGAQAVPIKASIEVSGVIYPVLFQGRRSATLDIGGTLVSDPLAIDFAAGSTLTVRTFINIANGTQFLAGTSSGGPGFSPTGDGFSTGDVSDSAAAMTTATTSAFWNPIILGTPLGTPGPSVLAIGDSITAGSGDSGPNFSWFTRGMNNGAPSLTYAVGGATAQGFLAKHYYGGVLLPACTDVVVFLGTNDIAAARSFAQVQADLTSIYTYLSKRGLRVWGATILPRASSTDSWATTTNQTPISGFEAGGASVRGQVNAWIRTTPSPLSGYFEVSDQVESARDSGKWKVNGSANWMTADGVHPSSLGHSVMAAGAPLSASSFPAV